MNRAILLLLLSALSLWAEPQPADDVPAKTLAAIRSIQIGMREADVVALLRPLALESGRVTYGGTGSGVLYFRISETQQLRIGIGALPNYPVDAIPAIEPLGVWTRDRFGGLSVQPRKPKP